MGSILFPICTYDILAQLPNCRALAYQEFATVNQCTALGVIVLYENKSDYMHYDIADDRYLVLWNEGCADSNINGRRLWTKTHESGYIILKHLPLVTESVLAENDLNDLIAPESESGADQFTTTLLCPMPLYKIPRIGPPSDIKRVFGLSEGASEHRWSGYVKWIGYHRKTA